MSDPGPRPVRLIICGSADRGDDGAPLSAVAGLLAGLPPHLLCVLEIKRCENLRLADLVDLPEGRACVIADAVTGVPAGAVMTIPLAALGESDAMTGPRPRSSHELPIGRLLAAAELLRERPISGSFVGIGGRSFGFGRPLGRAVRAALPDYRSAIEAALINAAARADARAV